MNNKETQIGEIELLSDPASKQKLKEKTVNTSEIQRTHSTGIIPGHIPDPDPDPLQTLLRQKFENFMPTIINKSETISGFPTAMDMVSQSIGADIRPMVVSIGPFHHREQYLQRMENKKTEFMWDLLRKCRSNAKPIPTLLAKIRELEMQARASYSGTMRPINRDDFVYMLLLDSCFIICFLISISNKMQDNLISFDWNIKVIRSDLLMLENQIPMFVLRQVYTTIRPFLEVKQLPIFNHILAPFIYMDIPQELYGQNDAAYDVAYHLLDLYWLCFMPDMHEIRSRTNEASSSVSTNIQSTTNEILSRRPHSSQPNLAEIAVSSTAPTNIPSATELQRVAGVTFKQLEPKSGFKASFSKGVMRIPYLKIDPSKTIILTNLVGYEKSLNPDKRKVSSYMLLMDSLINTEQDVELLQECGVLVNGLSNNASAAIFFNEIGNKCTVNYNHLFVDLFDDVNEYYKSKWKRTIASLKRNYCSSPWAKMSVCAGASSLLLTVAQAVLGGMQTYYTLHPPK